MSDLTLQVPAAVGTSGQVLVAVNPNAVSSLIQQVVSIGDATSTGKILVIDTSGAAHVVSASSGLVQVLTTGTYLVTGTMSLSSGTVTLSSNPTVISASSGVVQVLSSGPITGTVGLSSGTVTLSSNPTVISASSGVVQVLTSGTLIVAMTSGTVTLSSNPTVITASSGNVGVLPSTSLTYTAFSFGCSSSASLTSVSTGNRILYGWNVGSQSAGQAAIRCYNSTTATVGSTTNLLIAIPVPASTAGGGNNLMLPQGVNFSGGITFVIIDSFNTTSTSLGTHSAGDVTGTIYYV